MIYEKTLPKTSVQMEGSSAYAESVTMAAIPHLSTAMEALKPGLGPHPLCLDIGANIGFTTLYLDQVLSGAEITCFEPHPKTFGQLQANITRNATGANRITTLNRALGAEAGELPFRDIDTYNTGNSLLKPGSLASHQASITVPVGPLDALAIAPGREISLIKIDVEGFEIEVLRGAPLALARTTALLLEFNHWCLTSIARIFPEDALAFLFARFTGIYVYDARDKGYRRIVTDADKWRFLHQNMVRFNVNDLLCTNDAGLITRLG